MIIMLCIFVDDVMSGKSLPKFEQENQENIPTQSSNIPTQNVNTGLKEIVCHDESIIDPSNESSAETSR